MSTTPETPRPTHGLSDEERIDLIREMGWDPERVSPSHPVFAAPRFDRDPA